MDLLAIEIGEGAIAAIGIVISGIIGGLTAAIVKLKQTISSERREDRKLDDGSKVTTFDQMQIMVKQLTSRVEQQDARIDARDTRIQELSSEISDCHGEKSRMEERIKWLESFAGKNPGSGVHPNLRQDEDTAI